jgi:hypothetical protein
MCKTRANAKGSLKNRFFAKKFELFSQKFCNNREIQLIFDQMKINEFSRKLTFTAFSFGQQWLFSLAKRLCHFLYLLEE